MYAKCLDPGVFQPFLQGLDDNGVVKKRLLHHFKYYDPKDGEE
jgi:hypothetical protein